MGFLTWSENSLAPAIRNSAMPIGCRRHALRSLAAVHRDLHFHEERGKTTVRPLRFVSGRSGGRPCLRTTRLLICVWPLPCPPVLFPPAPLPCFLTCASSSYSSVLLWRPVRRLEPLRHLLILLPPPPTFFLSDSTNQLARHAMAPEGS